MNGWSLKAEWAGFDLVDFIELAEPDSSAEYLRATSIGGYEDTTRIDQLVNGGAMLVTHMNGEPLPAKRGRPMRLMIFDLYQFKGVKSLQMLEFVSEYRPGTWQTVGYDDATIQPYPHMAVDSGEDLMPDAEVLRSSANTNKV